MSYFRFFLALWMTCSVSLATSQTLFRTSTGEISFYSKTPLEDIQATNQKVGAIVNASTKELAIQMRITDFQFPNKLMQEHFNENYLESEKFPTAKFVGKIKEELDFSKAGTYEVTAAGNLSIHGVTKPVVVKGRLTSAGNEMRVNFAFQVRPEDYEIEVPSLVFDKIAETIDVSGRLILVK
jgi:polyisoprenoid-binding protein YceI